MELINLLKFVTESLEESDIAYMISGSLAMNIYTTPRLTRDIDIVISLAYSKIDAIADI